MAAAILSAWTHSLIGRQARLPTCLLYTSNDSDEVKNIIPNQEIVKNPQIENTGNNDALVFIRVEIPQETFTDEDDGTGGQKKQDLFRLKGVSDQWEPLRTETVAGEDGKAKTSYVYGYKKTCLLYTSPVSAQ